MCVITVFCPPGFPDPCDGILSPFPWYSFPKSLAAMSLFLSLFASANNHSVQNQRNQEIENLNFLKLSESR